jgi:hypothetical protein
MAEFPAVISFVRPAGAAQRTRRLQLNSIASVISPDSASNSTSVGLSSPQFMPEKTPHHATGRVSTTVNTMPVINIDPNLS